MEDLKSVIEKVINKKEYLYKSGKNMFQIQAYSTNGNMSDDSFHEHIQVSVQFEINGNKETSIKEILEDSSFIEDSMEVLFHDIVNEVKVKLGIKDNIPCIPNIVLLAIYTNNTELLTDTLVIHGSDLTIYIDRTFNGIN